EGDRERVVVPPVTVGPARRGRPGDLRGGRVVAEPQCPVCAVPRPITAGARDRRRAAVGAGVALWRVAGVDARGRVRAAEADGQRGVVPAVRVRASGRARSYYGARVVQADL